MKRKVVLLLDADGIYGLMPQQLIDEEDEKLCAWRQDTDIVSVYSDILSLI